ncbi:hypothetical protein CYY_009794 [Polysphondylium violaceum]|uniref:Short-chain dehydrogenase/reductase family protein n=1 Tax=Polysphondylium violaceum TaxID=133409 RepID=A0A8J4PLP5_9MYCE|nr:hypothetical protein CYY_009794 [Polysphondylium violaceum]
MVTSDSFKNLVLSFKSMLDDFLMIIISLVWSIILIFLSPILHLLNQFKNKVFPPPKTIVITGASSGIGKSLAIEYAAPGITLGITGRNKERLEEVKKQCVKKGATVETSTIDITEKEKIAHWLQDFDRRHQVDVIYANAAVSELSLGENFTYEEKAYELVNININGALNTVLPLLENFRKRNHGQIVLVSSLSAYISYVFPTYAASKSFITHYGLTLRQELKNYGVGCTVIAPGFVITPMSDTLKMESLPFSVSAERAAQVMIQGVQENRAFVGFSLPTLFSAYMMSLVPPNLRDAWNSISSLAFPYTDSIESTKSKDQVKYRTSFSSSIFYKTKDTAESSASVSSSSSKKFQ